MGFGFRVAPGVRIRMSSRGVSAGLGPRVARVHVGSRGGIGLSSGVGPFSTYSSLSSGRSSGSRRSRSGGYGGPTASSIAAQERAQRKLERLQEIQEVANENLRLAVLAAESFAPITKPTASPPPLTTPEQLSREVRAARKAATKGIGLFKRAERRAAQDEAATAATAAAAARDQAAVEHAAQEQRNIDAWWEALHAGVPDTVLATVNQALSDNERPSAAVATNGSEVSVIVIAPGLDEIPQRKYAETASGNPTVKNMTKTERNTLHLIAVWGHMIATLKETFAVAPTCDRVRLVMLERSGSHHAVLVAGVFTRQHITGTDWSQSSSFHTLDQAEELRMNLVGRTQELRPVDVYGDPDLQALVEAADAAEWVED